MAVRQANLSGDVDHLFVLLMLLILLLCLVACCLLRPPLGVHIYRAVCCAADAANAAAALGLQFRF